MANRRLIAAGVLLAGALAQSGSGETRSTAHPVVVELFTAQGCSSCPPADRLLSALGRDAAANVVPLAFHVDSWNTLGWIDPFSKPEWTRRQEFYARLLRARGVYTPQAVIDGGAELVGNDEPAMRAAIARAAALPAASVALSLRPTAEAVAVTATIEVPAELRERKLSLMLAVYEVGLETPVKRGENGGRTLRDDYVVRSLKRAARLDGQPSATVEMSLALDRVWKRENLGVAAFVQDARSLTIHGAAAAPLPADRPPAPSTGVGRPAATPPRRPAAR
jgi:hypothetical protein